VHVWWWWERWEGWDAQCAEGWSREGGGEWERSGNTQRAVSNRGLSAIHGLSATDHGNNTLPANM
jgi:hypothetical protein